MPRPGELLTHTGESISTVSLDTVTGEATRGVGTDSISVTVMSTSGTLIKICNSKYIPTGSMYPCQFQVTSTGAATSQDCWYMQH